MSEKKRLKTWIELDSAAASRNLKTFRRLLNGRSKIMSVVKSNAYGHGLMAFSRMMDRPPGGGGVDGFGVDSFVEGDHLRREGIRKPILVLGYTFPSIFPSAKKSDLTVTISAWDGLRALKAFPPSKRPDFHLKIDTGMHREGFYTSDMPAVAKFINNNNLPLRGIYTHFASAKDINYPSYTKKQFSDFLAAEKIIKFAGLTSASRRIERHVAATGGALVSPDYHLDWVRLGIGLYGLWPSKELEVQLGNEINLKPVLSWHSTVSEVKPAAKGSFIGYDLVERLRRDSKIAVVPMGYWHGCPRILSGTGC